MTIHDVVLLAVTPPLLTVSADVAVLISFSTSPQALDGDVGELVEDEQHCGPCQEDWRCAGHEGVLGEVLSRGEGVRRSSVSRAKSSSY